MHFADIELLLRSLLEMADSVEVERTVSVRYSPFKNEYVDPSVLTAILSKVSALAAALDDESVRAGASAKDVRRARSQLEARLVQVLVTVTPSVDCGCYEMFIDLFLTGRIYGAKIAASV